MLVQAFLSANSLCGATVDSLAPHGARCQCGSIMRPLEEDEEEEQEILATTGDN